MSEPSLRPALRLGAIILAAGGSSRMGQPKQLLPIEGIPLLLRNVAALASSAWPVVVGLAMPLTPFSPG